jgi:hypothetical protein
VDPISAEALTSLKTALEALLPPQPDAALIPTLSINPLRITPTGLNGFVGLHDDPRGELYGRRVRAMAVVDVKARELPDLDVAVTAVTGALIAADPVVLRQRGILSMALDELGPKSVSGSGANQIAEREVSLNVLFDYVKEPAAAEGVISQVPVNLTVDSATEHLTIA